MVVVENKEIKRRNIRNRKKTRRDSDTGFRGVSYEEHASEEAKYRAYLMLYNKYTKKQTFFHIGMYPTAEEASLRRTEFISRLF